MFCSPSFSLCIFFSFSCLTCRSFREINPGCRPAPERPPKENLWGFDFLYDFFTGRMPFLALKRVKTRKGYWMLSFVSDILQYMYVLSVGHHMHTCKDTITSKVRASIIIPLMVSYKANKYFATEYLGVYEFIKAGNPPTVLYSLYTTGHTIRRHR